MTILEAMREPITVQGLVNLALGILIGMGFCIAMVAIVSIPVVSIAGTGAQAPVPATSTPCAP